MIRGVKISEDGKVQAKINALKKSAGFKRMLKFGPEVFEIASKLGLTYTELIISITSLSDSIKDNISDMDRKVSVVRGKMK